MKNVIYVGLAFVCLVSEALIIPWTVRSDPMVRRLMTLLWDVRLKLMNYRELFWFVLLNVDIRKFISSKEVTVWYVNIALSAVGHDAPHLLGPVEIVVVRHMAEAFKVIWVVDYTDLQVQNLELFLNLLMALEIKSDLLTIRHCYFYWELYCYNQGWDL